MPQFLIENAVLVHSNDILNFLWYAYNILCKTHTTYVNVVNIHIC